MKGIIGGLLIGVSVGLLYSNGEGWWLVLGAAISLIGGVHLTVASSIESSIDRQPD